MFYQLGVLHAMKARSAALVFAAGNEQLPFDVGSMPASAGIGAGIGTRV